MIFLSLVCFYLEKKNVLTFSLIPLTFCLLLYLTKEHFLPFVDGCNVRLLIPSDHFFIIYFLIYRSYFYFTLVHTFFFFFF